MKTKLITLILIIFFSGNLVLAQEAASKEKLSETLNTYMGLVENLDMAGTLDYIHPKIFEMVPRETMEKGMDEFFNNGMHMKMYGSKITKIHDFVQTDAGVYTLVDYDFTMEMGLPEEEKEEGVADASSEEEDELDAVEFTRSILAMQHGEENVQFDEDKQFFIIKASNTMYAIYEKDFDGWKFFEKKDDGQGAVMMGIITEEVMEKLK